MTKDEWIGTVVRVLRGRETGRVFLVTEMSEDGMLLLSDGRYRRLERPKKKKIKHVEPIGKCMAEIKRCDDKMTNRGLWKALAEYRDGEG
jgi:ribosomal protein L14E/L6E/L27E